jgi:CRISPR/Cas system CMR-associated protein Cmr5 small subunit
MENLDQIRARNALQFADAGGIANVQGGEVIKKIPPLIMNHGLLATAAFSYSEKEGWQKVFDAIAFHLSCREVAVLPETCGSRQKMMVYLSEDADSETLKQATSETMAWLGYARRFVKKENGGAKE